MPTHPPDLKVTISLDSPDFSPEQPIVLHATITNEGEEPVKILEPSPEDMTFEIAVLDASGLRRDYLGPYGLKKMDRNAGRYLAPGETVTLQVSLHENFDLPAGEYRVKAAYRTLNYPDVDVAFCRIPSNELSFVLPSPDQQGEP
jgi:hypothetical protein